MSVNNSELNEKVKKYKELEKKNEELEQELKKKTIQYNEIERNYRILLESRKKKTNIFDFKILKFIFL